MDKHSILTILKPYKLKLIQLMLTELCSGICAAVFAWNAAHILNGVFLHHMSFSEAAPYFEVLLFALCLRSLLTFPAAAAADALSLAVREQVRLRLHEALLARSPLAADLAGGGELLTLVMETTDGLDDFFSRFLPQLLEAIVLLPLLFSIALGADAWTGFLFLVTLPIAPFLLNLVGRVTRQANERQWNRLCELSQGFSELLRGMTTIKIFGRSLSELTIVRTLSEDFGNASLHVLRLAFVSAFVLELITTLSIALIAVSIGLRLLADTMAFEPAFFLLLLAPEFYRPLRQSGMAFHAGINAAAAAKRIQSFLAPSAASAAARSHTEQTQMPPAIRFEHVSYHYPARSAEVLRDLSFKIPAGSFIVLAGDSGSGKSTILHLLMKADTPSSGEIYINDLPLTQIEPRHWHNFISYVPQEPHLFRASLRDNVAMFDPAPDDEKIRTCLQAAALSELLQEDTALDRRLGDGFAALSAGQRRRIGLARALYRDTPILLLDEITAGLDAQNEHQVLATIISRCEHRTILFATHRPAAMELTDQIIQLDGGRLETIHMSEPMIAEEGGMKP